MEIINTRPSIPLFFVSMIKFHKLNWLEELPNCESLLMAKCTEPANEFRLRFYNWFAGIISDGWNRGPIDRFSFGNSRSPWDASVAKLGADPRLLFPSGDDFVS